MTVSPTQGSSAAGLVGEPAAISGPVRDAACTLVGRSLWFAMTADHRPLHPVREVWEEDMIKIKHVMEPVGVDDGARLWVEPVGLTREFQEWCQVDALLTQLGPPPLLWNWHQQHADPKGHEIFSGAYRAYLAAIPHQSVLRELARVGSRSTFTLLYQGPDSEHNTAKVLQELLEQLAGEPIQ